ncbi:MAG: hypothetical protein AB7O45_06155 [Alphaproteobacteria bacterium]
MRGIRPALTIAAALALVACASGAGDDILGGDPPRPEASVIPLIPPTADDPRPATLAARAAGLQSDLATLEAGRERRQNDAEALRRAAAAEVDAYDAIVKRMGERIAAGAAPRNPELLADWTEARRRIGRVDTAVGRLRVLGAEVASDRALAAYLRDSARGAQALSGTDADMAELKRIEAGFGETGAGLERLSGEIGGEASRHAAWVDTERRRAETLFAAIQGGGTPPSAVSTRPAPNVASAVPPPETAAATAATRPVGIDGRRPFVVLRFDRPDAPFERPLFEAVQAAVSRQPDVRFDLVAVNPAGGGVDPAESRRNAERVLKALVEMGLPASRIVLSARTLPAADAPQVHLYVRPRRDQG